MTEYKVLIMRGLDRFTDESCTIERLTGELGYSTTRAAGESGTSDRPYCASTVDVNCIEHHLLAVVIRCMK